MVTEHITTSTRFHATSWELAADIDRVTQPGAYENGAELKDASILAIAAAYASPGTIGRGFTQLATTGSAPLDSLLSDIDANRRTLDADTQQHLDLFLIWLSHRSSLVVE